MLERIDESVAKMLIGNHYEEGCDYYLETGGGGFRVIKSNRETLESEAYYVKDTPKDDGTRTPIWDVQSEPLPECRRKPNNALWKIAVVLAITVIVITVLSIVR